MADASREASSSTVKPADDPESTIEINIKTLDSQVHKLRVQKNVPVSVLKEKIVDATGVPLDQQRLIFRGRVLRDDHLLSEYHLEDGFTLHLVARRAAEGQPSSGTSEGNIHANVNVAGNAGLLDDISRSVRDLLGSLGVAMSGSVTGTSFSVPLAPAPEGAYNTPGGTQPVNPAQPGFSAHQIHVAQLQPAGAIPRNMVIPDSMTTLSEYMERMDLVLQNNGAPPSRDSEGQQHPAADDANVNPRFPSPEVLSQVIERTQQLLGGSTASALSHIAQRIRNDAGTVDATVRREIQTESVQLGMAMQHMGAMLFELGRTMMMLRMGQSPSEAFVNSGPAVYINSTGPNPIMVQPSFQNTPPFGASNIPIMGGVSGAFGIVNPSRSTGLGDPFRNINAHTTGAPAASGSSVAAATSSGGAVNGDRQDAARTQGGNPSNNSAVTRGLPPRTVVAAIPARSSVEAPNHVLSVLLPVQRRSQVAVPNQSTTPQVSQNTMDNGSQQNSTPVVPQAAVSGVAGIPSIVAQINQHVANALAATTPVQAPSSAQNTDEQEYRQTVTQINQFVADALSAFPSSAQNAAEQGSCPSTESRASELNSSTATTTQLHSEPSISNNGQASLHLLTHANEQDTCSSNLTPEASTVTVPSVEGIQQHPQTEDARLSCEESTTSDLSSGGPSATSTHDVTASISAENHALENESLDGVDARSHKPSAGGKSEPLGLGGGLIPKRRTRTEKPSGSTSDANSTSVSDKEDVGSMARQLSHFLQGFAAERRSNTTNTTPPPPTTQPTRAPLGRQGGEGQPVSQFLQGFASERRSNSTNSAPPSSTTQPTRAPLGRQGGERQPDIGSMISGMLNNPAFGNLLSNVATQAGGSRADLRSVMEGLQSPAIVDTISNMVQNVDEEDIASMFGSGRGQGGIDLSRMMQQMMPVVSQVLGGAGARRTSANTNSGQQQRNDSGEGNNSNGRSGSQIDVQQARQLIEQHESPENIFSAVLETAARAYGEDDGIQGMIEELVSDPELSNGYLELLVEQVGQRIQSETQSKNQS